MIRALIRVAALACIPVSTVVACTRNTTLGELAPANEFASTDSGPREADTDSEAGLVAYCPTNECPPGWATCPGSRFPCDVNLRTDPNNCGGCAAACPPGGENETFSCIEGVCAMRCRAGFTFDCDGLADNGCEAHALDDDHCGSCDKKCTDPNKGCTYQGFNTSEVDCGCPKGKDRCGSFCIDTADDDTNCGGCGIFCDPSGGGAPEYSHSYYGCRDGGCGALKCLPSFADCDGVESNGCETSLVSNDNCGGCGLKCPTDQTCRLDSTQTPQCMCPAGKSYCELWCTPDGCIGQCVDLTSDANNCGACFAGCSSPFEPLPYAQRTCDYGTCVTHCESGRADCNDSEVDGCEVNTESDPRNCGGCGNACDAVAGQACVAGRCVVAPCPPEDAGGGAR